MRKKDLIAELTVLGGPIEDHLKALGSEGALPALSIGMCVARIDEAGPPLRDLLVRASLGWDLTDEEAVRLFRGVHILGGARDQKAFVPLLRFLSQPEDILDAFLGDVITAVLPRIVVGVFNGDADLLFEAIRDRSRDQFVRDALLGAVTFLTWEGRIERPRTAQFLEDFHERRAASDDDYVWVGWQQAVAMLGLTELVPRVRTVFDGQIIDPKHMSFDDFASDLAQALDRPTDATRFERAHLGYIGDVLEELQRWSDWEDSESEADELPLTRGSVDQAEPVRNLWRHVGRNDPCPCGSGKKAKKCCLAG